MLISPWIVLLLLSYAYPGKFALSIPLLQVLPMYNLPLGMRIADVDLFMLSITLIAVIIFTIASVGAILAEEYKLEHGRIITAIFYWKFPPICIIIGIMYDTTFDVYYREGIFSFIEIIFVLAIFGLLGSALSQTMRQR